MNKDLINSRFAKTLSTYEENALIQKRMAKRLLEFLNKKNFSSILEIGCGTGLLTKLVNENLEFEVYKAVDIVSECESYINNISEKIKFVGADFEEYLVNSSERYDLIISNASLQWAEDFEKTVNVLKSRLNSNGVLLFSTFGKENFREIYHVIGTTLNYYSIKELNLMFDDFSSKIEEEIHIVSFNNPKDVLRHLQATGVNAIESKSWTKSDLLKFENGYNNLCSRRITLTYNPIYVLIQN